jgi:hypothetical protein
MLRIGYTCAAKACNALQKHATWVVNKQHLRQVKAASWESTQPEMLPGAGWYGKNPGFRLAQEGLNSGKSAACG